MKIILSILFGIVLFGAGCAKPVAPQAMTETTSGNPFEGTWVFEGPTEYGEQDGFSISLHRGDDGVVTGTFSAVLSPNARRIDTGNFIGRYDSYGNDDVVYGHWVGDRGNGETIIDEGEAQIQWDSKTDTITWLNTPGPKVSVDDYSLPKKVIMRRDSTSTEPLED